MNKKRNFIFKELLSSLHSTGIRVSLNTLTLLTENDIWFPFIEEKMITYLRKRDVIPLAESENPKQYYLKHAQRMKIGKFLQKINQYSASNVESLLAEFAPHALIEIPGKYIPWAYLVDNNLQNTGSLSSSCMRYQSLNHLFRIYQENARMIGTMFKNKISSRALIWDKVTLPDGDIISVVDRIYGNPAQVLFIKKWAWENGYYTKVEQTYTCYEVENSDERFSIHGASIKLKNKIDCRIGLPYFDTFYETDLFTFREGEYITTLKAGSSLEGYRHLRSTSGEINRATCVICGDVLPFGTEKYCEEHANKELQDPLTLDFFIPEYYGYQYKPENYIYKVSEGHYKMAETVEEKLKGAIK